MKTSRYRACPFCQTAFSDDPLEFFRVTRRLGCFWCRHVADGLSVVHSSIIECPAQFFYLNRAPDGPAWLAGDARLPAKQRGGDMFASCTIGDSKLNNHILMKVFGLQLMELVEYFCPDCQLLALELSKARTGDGVAYWLSLIDTAKKVGHYTFHEMILREGHDRRLLIPDSWQRKCIFYNSTPTGKIYYIKRDSGGFET